MILCTLLFTNEGFRSDIFGYDEIWCPFLSRCSTMDGAALSAIREIYICMCVCVCVCVRESEKRKIVCVYEVQFRDLHALDIRWER